MGEYNFFEVAKDDSLFESVEDYDYRKMIINSIKNLRSGNGFELYYKRFVVGTSKKNKKLGGFDKQDFRKFYLSENYMESVIGKFTSYMPRLTIKSDIDKDLHSLIKKSLMGIKWEAELYDAICDSMEAMGDVYLAIYFDSEKDKMPKLRLLKSENMIDILVDKNERPTAYVYEENKNLGKKLNPMNGEVMDGTTTTTRLVFTKGKITKYRDGSKPKVISNNKCIIDDIPLIHIQAEKKAGNIFSDIPAKAYVEDVLHLDKCTTTISQILGYQGFGLRHIVDGVLDSRSRPVPGGYMSIDTKKETRVRGAQAKVYDFQINNQLEANFKEKEEVKSALYEKAKLIAPDTEKIVGKTDSGKVFQHFRLPLQTKVRKYRDNIIDGMSLWFKALLYSNGFEGTEYEGLSFYKDKYVIETSTDEKLLNQQLEVVTRTKTVEEVKQENGDSPEEIAKVLAENKEKEEALKNEKNDIKNVEKA